MMITEDNSMEFDLYEDARRSLTEFLVREGYDALKAERIAFYVIQGVRGVPKFLATLTEPRPTDEIRIALRAVLDNAPAFEKARAMLTTETDRAD